MRVVEISSNDAWMRDCGPTFVIDAKGRRRGVDWTFNAWGGIAGGLYFPWDRDDEVARKVLEIEGADRYRTRFVLEGGAIHVDGQGTCLTTEECLLNPNRNADMTRADVEEALRRYLGVSTVIWLGAGVYLDETGGHVDELACFTSPGHVALTWTEDRTDPQYEISCDAYQRLRHARDARGRALTIHKIHQPGPLYMTAEEAAGIDVRDGTRPRRAGDRLPASYINFYIANRCVVMPLYDKRWDAAAVRTLRRLFPDPQSAGRRDARSAARRRQHPLHHPASTALDGPLSRPNGTLPHARSRKPLFYAPSIPQPFRNTGTLQCTHVWKIRSSSPERAVLRRGDSRSRLPRHTPAPAATASCGSR